MKAKLTFVTVKNPNTGQTEPAVRAQAKVDNKTITAQDSNDKDALQALKTKVQQYETIKALKAQYPKEVEL